MTAETGKNCLMREAFVDERDDVLRRSARKKDFGYAGLF
jgi:hypothetical protein